TEVEAEDLLQLELIHVVADLYLGAPQSRPVRILLEREAAEGGRDVAGSARVGVVAPGAAQAVRLLEDRERVDAGLLQLDAEAEPREARADDRDASLCHSGQDTPAAARPTMARSAPRRTLTRRLQAGGSGPACAAFSPGAQSGSAVAICLPGCTRAASSATDASSGSSTVKTAPCSVPALSARTLPPWRSTSPRTIARPSPRPPCRRVPELSACRNRSKTYGRKSGLMPSPVSRTVSRARSSTRSSAMRTRPT